MTSFDVHASNLPFIEIHGTEGTISLPDPNCFGGPVNVWTKADAWQEIPLTHGYAENSRGIGVADMAYALRSGRDHRANGELALHVLDTMHAIHESYQQGHVIGLSSTCSKPAPLPCGLVAGELDD